MTILRHDTVAGPPPAGKGLEKIRAIVRAEAGIALGPDKDHMVSARLAKRLCATGCQDIAQYLVLLDGPGGSGEVPHLVSAMTTNVTRFFRERHHFDLLQQEVAEPNRSSTILRLWSAGCSTGQEPYSMAMAALAAGLPAVQVQILATDINPAALEVARQAYYERSEIDSIPPSFRRRFVLRGLRGDGTMIDAVRAMVEIRQLNLIGDWDLSDRFDAIFCRNVAIYFDCDTQERLWQRLAARLRPGGWLFTGHAESLPADLLSKMEMRGPTSYTLRSPCEADGP